MAFDLGKGRSVRPSMNVTPLVDVVLVLLIIFMVITPLLARQVSLRVPPKEGEAAAPPPAAEADTPIVLQLDREGTMHLNKIRVTKTELAAKLEPALAARSDRVLFFDAHDDLPYAAAMEALDAARGAGAVVVVLPETLP
jgi:biopolymer transport protein ExbD